ncbi:D-arabinono-1,4-lactone oxidase [Fibrella aquatilis]|uniref:FAD-binding protein n=1 Tax=Fibrella aquatilis TaxID=2817059 RepID=A0A939G487_9BACT|nr:D-arabinono-1,4-lactone oxidase [Fibrella aquatilis]MBO0931804.1 FAD-binding protein [Fibrella aquatilis]
MKNLPINDVTYWLPESVAELMTLVQQAKDNNQTIAVRGAAHSFPMVKQAEQANMAHPNTSLYIMLSHLNSVTFDRPNYRVTVQAGCHLGYDPFDPTGVSKLENSLLYQLDPFYLDGMRPDLTGWCLPDLGGISHQTVGGFIATGSSGGSTKFAFENAIVAVDLVYYGHQNPDDPGSPVGVYQKTVQRPAPANLDDDFFGLAFANLGMMGIITAVTFDCSPVAFTDPQGNTYRTFDIAGQEAITTIDTCAVNLFSTHAPGPTARPDLQTFLQQTDYTRLIWWPQTDLEATPPNPGRVVVWQAKRTVPQSSGTNPYVPYSPYQELTYTPGGAVPVPGSMPPGLLPLAMLADLLFTAIGQWPIWLENVLGPNNPLTTIIEKGVADNRQTIFQDLLNVFVKLDPLGQHQQFSDSWWRGLPMDNQMSDKLFPVWFTELWIPIEQTTALMNELHAFYKSDPNHASTFCVEIYAAGRTDFWLSPAYQHDVIRIDIFWFANNTGDPIAYYSLFWNLLRKYKFRPHWGKYMPNPAQDPAWKGYLAANYPKWDQWHALRQKMDPYQLLVSDYWRDRLEILQPH